MRIIDLSTTISASPDNTPDFLKIGIDYHRHTDLSYSHIERLVNLGPLPPFGFKVACFPLKIKGGSAGPTRVVAILS